MRLIQHLFVMSLICSAMISPSFADCVPVSQGQKIIIEVSACEEIDASKNSDVQRLARIQDVVALYSGALVKDKKGALWMYPSSGKESCSQFPVNEKTEKKGYYTCCDTGSWGKCIFGGRFLGDVNGKPIDAFQ
jgi:hypothetical protein